MVNNNSKLNSEFIFKIAEKMFSSLPNNLVDNWDSIVLGEEPSKNAAKGIVNKIKLAFKNKYNLTNNFELKIISKQFDQVIGQHGAGLSNLYSQLSDQYSKDFLIEILVYRILGYKKVKLRTNNQEYWNRRKIANNLKSTPVNLDSGLKNKILTKYNLAHIKLPIELISYPPAISHTFSENHYGYHRGDVSVDVEKGDIVIDAGAAWGDTSLLFSYKTGKNGKVISFEFDPTNLKIFNQNLLFNPELSKQIVLEQKALWDKGNIELSFDSNGPATRVIENSLKTDGLSVLTTTIDEVARNFKSIDFIKMDIEGAEPKALLGAVETIRKFKPKLAISLYHNLSDFTFVADFISGLGVDYDCYISHPTIFENETVLIATPKKSLS